MLLPTQSLAADIVAATPAVHGIGEPDEAADSRITVRCLILDWLRPR